MLFGLGGNIAVSVGAQGTLIVDAEFPELVPRYLAAIRDGRRRHRLRDQHALALRPCRRQPRAWAYRYLDHRARELARDADEGQRHQHRRATAVPAEGVSRGQRCPSRRSRIACSSSFNDETVDLYACRARAHDGRRRRDFPQPQRRPFGRLVYNNAGYPFIDTDNGGDLDGTIAFCEAVLKELRPGATVIPGHGAVAKYDDLVAYIAMLKGVRAKLAALIQSGATLEQVIAAKPTAEWDARYGDPTRIVNRGYAALSRSRR